MPTPPAERLKEMTRAVQDAEVQKRLREGQLAELRPKRDALEKESLERFGVPTKGLAAWADAKEAEGQARLDAFAARLEAARGEAR